jgi:2-polyprenyl-3-methyl-5-hydroxy-6-metoxy-1,4-benzoquinol methylase
MHLKPFLSYRRKFLALLDAVVRDYPKGTFYDQAVPSYIHPNPFAQVIFWERQRQIMSMMGGLTGGTVLDFGTGSGVLLPFLHSRQRKVVAVDIEPELVGLVVKKARMDRVTLHGDPADLEQYEPGTFDAITAMDVLEHVDDVPGLAELFRRLLKKDGRLLVSGPTETKLYQFGRKVAGYDHHTHVRNISHIEDDLSDQFNLRQVRQVPPLAPLTLFRITSWEPRSEPRLVVRSRTQAATGHGHSHSHAHAH